jgi:hypothetical protein
MHAGRQTDRSLALAAVVVVAASLVGAGLGVAAGAEAPGEAEGGEDLLEEIGGGWAGWGSLALMVATFFLGWARTGVALTRPVELLRRWRVVVHIWTSTIALGLALLHTVELVLLDEFVGWLSGTIATVYLLALFVTGWWRPYLEPRWGRSRWRIVHWLLALGVLAMSGLHWLAIEGALPRV